MPVGLLTWKGQFYFSFEYVLHRVQLFFTFKAAINIIVDRKQACREQKHSDRIKTAVIV